MAIFFGQIRKQDMFASAVFTGLHVFRGHAITRQLGLPICPN